MHHLEHLVFAWLGTVLAVIFSAYAFWRGGPAERYGGAVILTGWFLTPLVQAHGPKGPGIGLGFLLVDWAVLIGLLIISVLTRRLWTVFACAFQFNAVASHYAGALAHIGVYTSVTALGIWSGYGLVVALGLGVWAYDRRRRAEINARKTNGNGPV